MSGSKLEVLRQHRNTLLLAEVAALLHDMGKCTAEFVHIPKARGDGNLDPYKAVFSLQELGNYSFSSERIQERHSEANHEYALHRLLGNLANLDVSFGVDNTTYSLREAIYFSRPRFAGHVHSAIRRSAEPLDLLASLHGTAHVEKEDPQPNISPNPPAVYSAFGLELARLSVPGGPENLTEKLAKLNYGSLIDKFDRTEVTELFQEAVGDTRFPINEVTLWDWSYVVASLYKSELARHFLTGEWREHDQLSWRLLRVNFDVLGLYTKAIKIADLLAYQNTVQRACDTVKQLVEEEYPLGNEVYRDTTGAFLTFPDLDMPEELKQEIRRRVEDIEPELAPRIAVGTAPGSTSTEQVRNLLHHQRREAKKALAYPFDIQNNATCWESFWNSAQQGSEVCPVCRLRPMREGEEACKHCVQRRQSRIEKWKQDPSTTIWLDEIADHNGRVALLVGKFVLDAWLSGDLVQTTLVRAIENNGSASVPKNPSPARLRRVWETCQRFWTQSVERILGDVASEAAVLRRSRMLVTPDNEVNWKENVPYDGTIDGRSISLLWLAAERVFVTIFTLQLAAGGAGAPEQLQGEWLGREVEVGEPGDPRRRIRFKVEAVTPAVDSWAQYRPYVTLLTSPDEFLALIPASEALNAADRIRKEYQKQFGKVQNRLPFFLGLVFFQRKIPLMTVMDTARRMLKQVHLEDEAWTVECSRKAESGKWHLRVSRDDERLHLEVPILMGDGTTEDVWYPYFFVDCSEEPSDRPYRFRHNSRWLVHVKNLREGDRVCATPSRFAYMFLEHTGQRFEFDAEKYGMLLDDLPHFIDMWNRLRSNGITDTGLRGVAQLLETKREMWGRGSQEFRRLLETTLKESGLWRQKGRPDAVTPEDVLCDRFFRCLELYLRILKARLKEKEDDRESAAV